MKSWHWTAGLALLCAFLVYRVIALGAAVDALRARIGDDKTPPAAVDKAPVVVDHSERIAELERGLEGVREDLALVSRQAENKADLADIDGVASKEQIVSVINQEAEKIRDAHLQFQRQRLWDFREKVLGDFAEQQGLKSYQEQQLRNLLSEELDSMAAIFRSEDLLRNPEQAASDWQAVLAETDQQVERVLDPQQLAAWQISRFIERRVLWPWLPEPEP